MIAPCDVKAARYAVEHWHYSRCLPAGKLVRFGVWEDGRFIGAVIYGRGAAPDLGSLVGLGLATCCELVRVALDGHVVPVSQIVADTVRQLRGGSPGLRAIVSFADPSEGHHGGIYQAGNWVYTGQSPSHRYRVNGQLVHPKTLHSRYGVGGQSVPWLREHVDPRAERVMLPGKHRYVLPLDKQIRRRVLKLAQPYPQHLAVEGSTVIRSPHQARSDGATPSDRSIAS